MSATGAGDAAITLRLRTIDELFVAPELDPMHGAFEDRSGIDRLISILKAGDDPNPGRLTILLPPDQITPGLADRLTAAMRGCCSVRSEELERQAKAGRFLGRRELTYGLFFLAACLLLAGLVQAWDGRWDFPRDFLSEGLIIIGWIALWHPIDLLLFERWPVKRDQRLLAHIQQMTLSIEPDR